MVCGKICGNIGIDIGFGKIEAMSDWRKKLAIDRKSQGH